MLSKISNSNIVISFVIIIVLAGCRRDPLKIDISDIDVKIEIERFDEDLFASKPEITQDGVNRVSQKYEVFFEIFIRSVLGIPEDSGVATLPVLNDFINDADIEKIRTDVKKQYPALQNISKEIEDGFKHYKYYFPNKPVPEIITFISGMQYAIITADSLAAIGLDMYLGENYILYEALGLPKFKTAKMTKDFIVLDCFKGWAQSEYEQDQAQRDLLSQIIYHGKILHFMEAMRPGEEKHKIIGYTRQQLEWCTENESNIWSFFISNNLLYSADQVKIARFINDGPGTGGFPAEAPSMLGNYIGWQIIKAFRERNKDISLAQLMEINNAQQILNKSGYKPKK